MKKQTLITGIISGAAVAIISGVVLTVLKGDYKSNSILAAIFGGGTTTATIAFKIASGGKG